jgi:chromosome segregation ATPase
MSDAERDDYESKCATLRDEVSQTKLVNQDLERELNQHLNILEEAEKEMDELKKDIELQSEDLQALQAERDEALEALQDKEQECEKLREEAVSTIERLEDEIEQKEQERNRLITEIENQNEDFTALQQEMKNVSESLVQLEDDREANLRKIQHLEQELDDANSELESLDKRLRDANSKNERLEIQLESCQGEISFLREEQEGDKIKIGELESALNTATTTIQDEKERFRDLDQRLTEERRQREILDSQEKEELQKVLTDLNLQNSKAKDEVRRLRKSLSLKEVEASTWKQRLDELESNLREALGNLDGTRSSLLKVPNIIALSPRYILITIVQDITKLQRDLDSTIQELDSTKNDLTEKDRLLRNRDALLESTGLESRRLSDLLERERQARRQEKANFDNIQRSNQTVNRTVQQHETRVVELEQARNQDRHKHSTLERQYKDQLLERNNLLLALWNRLSTLCGGEWARSNSLVNGELPSLDIIARALPGFSKNLILAVKTVENIVGNFRQRIRMIEKDLLKDYQILEHNLDIRMKRMDQLDKIAMAQKQSIGRPSTVRGGLLETNGIEVTKLKNENKMLKAELQLTRQAPPTATDSQSQRSPSTSGRSSSRASVAASLLRHHSTSAVEVLQQAAHQYPPVQSAPLQPSEQRWIHRLKELERRLKAEREARLLDRSGARKRLEESSAEKEELRLQLEREKERRESVDGLNGE